MRRMVWFVFVLAHGTVFAQHEIIFEKYRDIPYSDKNIQELLLVIKENKPDRVQAIAEKTGRFFISANETEPYLFVQNTLARYYYNQKKKEKAIQQLLKAVDLARNHQDTLSTEFSFVLYNLARFSLSKRSYEAAFDYIQRSSSILEIMNSPPYEVLLYQYNFTSSIARKLGDKGKALHYITKANDIAMCKNMYQILGMCYYEYAKNLEKHQYKLRAEFLEYAIEQFNKKDSLSIEYSNMFLYAHLMLISTYYDYLKDFDKTQEYILISEDIIAQRNFYSMLEEKQKNIFLTGIKNYKGYLKISQKEYAKALQIFKELEPVILENYGAVSVKMSREWMNLSSSFLHLQQFDSAWYYCEKSFHIGERLKWRGISKADNYKLRFQITSKQENYKLALHYAQLHLCEMTGNEVLTQDDIRVPEINPEKSHVEIVEAMINKSDVLSLLYADASNVEYLHSALDHLNKADKCVDFLLNEVVIDKAGIKLSELNKAISERAVGILIDLYEHHPLESYKQGLFYYLCQLNSNYLEFQMQEMEHFNSDSLSRSYHELKNKIAILENKYQAASRREDTQYNEKLKDSIFQLKLETILYQAEVIEKTSRFNKVHVVDYNEVIERLGEHSAMLAYYFNDKDNQLFTFVLDNNSFSYVKTSVGPDLYTDLELYRRHIKSGKNSITESERFYNQLIKPVYASIKDKENLIIIPGNTFAGLSFELLSHKTKPIISDYIISYQYSPIMWLRSSKNVKLKSDSQNILLVAPVFSKRETAVIAMNNTLRTNEVFNSDSSICRSGAQLAELPNSYKEIKEVSSAFSIEEIEEKILDYDLATEKNFKMLAKDFDIVHIASHGFTSYVNPVESGIFFAQEKIAIKTDITNDGFLFLNEIYKLDLKANLVVLSACKSGIGKVAKGEGMLALPRGFIYAGVPNVIASLWKVHDEKTKDLMISFYKHLLQEQVSYAQALRLAKLDCIKKGFLPLDWAGFVLIGN